MTGYRRFGLLAAVLGLAACRQIVGISSTSCAACTESSCSAEKAACDALPACEALAGCLRTCAGEPRCRSQCFLDNPVSDEAEVTAKLEACLSASCAGSCELGCGASLARVAPPDAAPDCLACMKKFVCSEAQQCAGSPRCQQEILCREHCATGDCIGACGLADWDGTEPLCIDTVDRQQFLTECSSPNEGDTLNSAFFTELVECRDQCRVGNDWTCVDHLQWPAVRGSPRELTLGLINIVDGSPIASATVTMCGSAACDPLIDRQQTSAGGVVRLLDRSPTFSGLGLDGYLSVSLDASFYPTTIQWGFPLSEVHGVLGAPIPVVPRGELSDLAGLFGVTIDPAMGHIAAVAVDCLGNQSSGVRFAVSGAPSTAQTFYFRGRFPNKEGPTDSSGNAFILNVAPGTYQMEATPDLLGAPSSRQTVVVRAGELTEVGMGPTP
jgi:hypothetical protein